MPLRLRERHIVGLLARYHRRALPEPEHPVYSLLNEADRQRVNQLASFLRLADGLDRTHSRIVQGIECRLSNDTVTLTCEVTAAGEEERAMGQKNADLFERTFGRKVMVVTIPASNKATGTNRTGTFADE